MNWSSLAGVLVLVAELGACTRAIPITDTAGERVWMIECGAAVSFSVCHTRAQKMCPHGYATLSEDAGFNRKEVRVQCLPDKNAGGAAAFASPTPSGMMPIDTRLATLKDLADRKLITPAEYEAKRKEILGGL